MTQPVSMQDVLFVIKSCPELGIEAKNEFDLLPKQMDEVVKPILHALGVDVSQEITVKAYKHRTLNDTVVIGYRYDGRMRRDREWTTGKGCNVMERISATSYYDPSLTRELCELVGTAIKTVENGSYTHKESDYPVTQYSDSFEADSALLAQLNMIALDVRGEITV